jgi:hypothetical protein
MAGGLFGDTGDIQAAIIYGQPVGRNWPQDALELQRLVRRDDFDCCLSKFISWSIRYLRANVPVPFILSYADGEEGHHGGVYQASGFVFVGLSKSSSHMGFNTDSGFIHARSCYARFGTSSIPKMSQIKPSWTPVFAKPKYTYIKPVRQKLKQTLRSVGLRAEAHPKPDNAACLLDAPSKGVSREHTSEAAP